MLNFFNAKYIQLSEKNKNDLFFLRKRSFKDRLNWSVICKNNKEFDEYDNKNVDYLLGSYQDRIVCGVRFIDIKNNNMITGTFYKYFKQINLPKGNYFEASRLFVDKERIVKFELNKYSISLMLFLSMIYYVRNHNYDGICAIISYQMLIIFRRAGWNVDIVNKGISEKNEVIYLITMPIDGKNTYLLEKNVKSKYKVNDRWPLNFLSRW
ncbi:acyl-homoserine-lactone synthase [Arsenophonus nasoniae]|uniref:Acyl-homoserine-lactone synthase n=2 Tax=Arsenophonus nasoniae TaxID=638 RepID=A0A4P7L7W4_9GAMM|nr:acyl-homoserine-lactone synthase [Arsenophonus nasoniae]QBY45132.1 Acyl-homoserine-lactone synthase [Arsenophonus nasoniae]WGM02189.1 acyl-homoserine-lactone synthase [Arsenophonus nasoniae]WGM05336.1 acyl-homoserine-lactone synthase [Arsenophonus nasoniae]WGM10342.1 acyl-homoserine-lactone synthase [Arsenophonus nasoniae]WGM15057.1 acyl-homoserine-lactone synthase [Arsenophonus nasoniae]